MSAAYKAYLEFRVIDGKPKRPNSFIEFHGHHCYGKPSPTYVSWRSIIHGRNYLVKMNKRKEVSVCTKWDNFPNFLKDMGDRPPYTKLWRIDKEKGFYKENCYWKPIGERRKKGKK